MKKIVIFLMTICIAFAAVLPTYAFNDQEITPYYNNAYFVNSEFVINDNGEITIKISFEGKAGVCTGASVDVQLQKNRFGLWSNVVDGEWHDNLIGENGSVTYETRVYLKGEYRIVYDIVVLGSGGSADVISGTIEQTYQ